MISLALFLDTLRHMNVTLFQIHPRLTRMLATPDDYTEWERDKMAMCWVIPWLLKMESDVS